MKSRVSMFIRFLIIALFAGLVTGCGDLMKIQQMSAEIASGDPYPADDPSKDVKLVAFNKDSIQMGIPVGWKAQPMKNSGDLKFKFTNDSGHSLLLSCFGMFVHRNDLQKTLQNVARAAVPDITKTAGMWELEVPSINPRFELYRGSKMTKGIPVSLDVHIAWRVNNRMSGCKYGLVYIAPAAKGKQNEYEFLSIVRSLR